MDYNVLGSTGLNVSQLSFGASALGSVFRPIDEENGIRAVHAALDAGINDTDVPRDRYFLSTKAGKYTAPGGPIADWHPAGDNERKVFAQAAVYCNQQGISLTKIAFQFSCHDSPFRTTMFSFSCSQTSSVSRNLAWCDEPLDQELLAEVLQILKPAIDKQWNYDTGIERLKDTHS